MLLACRIILSSLSVLKEIDRYFEQHQEPLRGCLAALRHLILNHNSKVTEVWRYRMPFYCYSDKRFCYLWVDKKRNLPYIGFVDGNLLGDPELLGEKRSRMKILLIDTAADLPVEKITALLNEAVALLKHT